MKSFKEILKEELRDPEFAQDYEEVSAEMAFALALTLRRNKLGYTQQALAEETGIKQPMIARIEHGQMPTSPTLQRLAKALKINIIFTGNGIILEPIEIKEVPTAKYVKVDEINDTYRQKAGKASSPNRIEAFEGEYV